MAMEKGAAFLLKVEQDAAAVIGRDGGKRGVELRAAIAFQTAEDIAGKAGAVQAGEYRLAHIRIADHQRQMLRAAIIGAEGNDLRIFGVGQRQPGAAGNVDAGHRRRQGKRGFGRAVNGNFCPGQRHGINGRDQAGVLDQCNRGTCRCRIAGQRAGAERALERGGEIEHRVGDGAAAGQIEPVRPVYPHRFRIGRGRRNLVGEVEHGSAARGDDQAGAAAGFQRGQRVGIGKFSGQDGEAAHAHGTTPAQGIAGGFGQIIGRDAHRSSVTICGM